ncbi:hypothetical protein NDU88_003325 [Pleurodeles waltl]|uniref:L1 transposable element RRM domain-containing protein n=1 Tax=Pleurodeles waltl TaxID=8319 RepID=A0AAV7WSS3_PLEWA|nr:hypothetical protein NDU88_003325 [Pleurodeles waltl]
MKEVYKSDKLEPAASLEGIGSDFQADRRGVPQFSLSRRPVGIQEEVNAGQDLQLSGEGHGHSIADILKALSVELKGGFETSNVKQAEIRSLCGDLGKKIDDLAGRTAVLEEEVGELRMVVEENKEQIRYLKEGEVGAMAKKESLENNQRRNNLRFLRVPEGLEEGDLKGSMARLIKQELNVEESEEDIAKDIQRVHQVLAKMPSSRDRPRKFFVYFQTYTLKKHILALALKKKSLSVNGSPFEIRSDLASVTLNKQWKLDKRIDTLKKLGATAQLKVPASLRVKVNNKMYNFTDWKEADELIRKIEKGSGNGKGLV